MRTYEIIVKSQIIFNKKGKSEAIRVADQRVPGSGGYQIS